MRIHIHSTAGITPQATMLTELVSLILLLLFIWILWRLKRGKINIPGPKGIPIIGVSHLMKPINKVHLKFLEWSQEYGPVVHAPLLTGNAIIVSSQEAIHEVTVTKGYKFGGRPRSFRNGIATERTGVLTSAYPDDTWKFLRKTSHKHLKQFGDGMSRLERVIEEVGQDMFTAFEEKRGKEIDPQKVIFDAALNSITFLITGTRTRSGDEIVEKMRDYEEQFLRVVGVLIPLRHIILDFLPWLRIFRIESWQMLQAFVKLEHGIWDDLKDIIQNKPEASSLSQLLMANIGKGVGITEKDVRKTSMNLLLAGVTTTSNTFYGGVNILAHHQSIQDTMLKEIRCVCPEGQQVSLPLRPQLPYCRAFLLELLRYTSVVAASVPHCAMVDETIQGYFVPRGTRIVVNIYGLHYNPKFWGDPEKFRPERFLDENGEVVSADHPNRKHLMPFGAGLRVCVGETLAMTRLFLWLTTLVNRFHVTPAPGNDTSTCDTKNSTYGAVLHPAKYEVIFTTR